MSSAVIKCVLLVGVAHQHEVLVLVVDGRLGGYAADFRASAS